MEHKVCSSSWSKHWCRVKKQVGRKCEMLQCDRQFFPSQRTSLSVPPSLSLVVSLRRKMCPTCVPGSPRGPCGCLAGQRRRSGRHECGLRGADWGRSEWGDNGEGGTRMTSKHMREHLADTHTHIRILLKSFTPLLHAGANWVNGYQTPVVWFILFLITRPLHFCHVVLSLRITTTPLSVVESKLLPQLYFGWPLTSLFANAAQSLTVNFYLNVKLILMIYFYSSITGGVCQSVSLNDNHLTYYTNHATFLKHLWRYISVISLDM